MRVRLSAEIQFSYVALKLFFFLIFLLKIFFLKFFKFSRHADLRGFGVAAYENMPAWRRPAAACITVNRNKRQGV